MQKQNASDTAIVQPWTNLYSAALPSARTGLFFNTFAYPTKIAPESIAVFIAAHTKPGDLVLDVFGGTGSTGIAALMCEHPTEAMKAIAEKLQIQPVWGARNAIVYELGKYGAFASSVMANPPEKQAFSIAAKELLKYAEDEMQGLYDTVDALGNPGTIRHIVYSDVVLCPHCDTEFSYYQGMVRNNPLRIDGDGVCPHCGHKDKSAGFTYTTQNVYDSLLDKYITRRKRYPVRIYGQTGANKWMREATESDIQQFEAAEAMEYPYQSVVKQIVWGELHRSGYHTGISHLHHFYTKRNFLVMSCLWEKATSFEPSVRDAIRLLLLSYNSSHATLMTRVVIKNGLKDFVLTGAQSGVLYVSSLPVEKNIFNGIKRKLGYFEDAFDYLSKCSGHMEVVNASSHRLVLPDHSVDYVFTDPPFGGFIPYAEVNQINELWLGEPTSRDDEIIISPSQKKDVICYQKMITKVFSEIHRVLKDDSYATVVFHSSKAAVWNALRSAYSDAGLLVDATTSLDKSQASFKQVVSEGSVQKDPLILLSKGKAVLNVSDSQELLDMAISIDGSSAVKNERQIYADYVGQCLKLGITVDYDAKTAYDYIARKLEAVR